MPATLLNKILWHSCFPMNFTKFLRTPFFIKHLWWLLLSVSYAVSPILTDDSWNKKTRIKGVFIFDYLFSATFLITFACRTMKFHLRSNILKAVYCINNGWKTLIIFAKHSIQDVWQGLERAVGLLFCCCFVSFWFSFRNIDHVVCVVSIFTLLDF